MMQDCVFCKIVAGIIPAEFIYQDETVVAFADIHPKAPVHLLVAPRKHFQSLNEAAADIATLGILMAVTSKLARQENLNGGYKVVINVGKEGGQVVPHLHVHILGGRQMEE